MGPIEIYLMNFAIFFGHYLIISQAINLQFGNTGIPNMSSNLSLSVGAYAITAVTMRLALWACGVVVDVYSRSWSEDGPSALNRINSVIEGSPAFGIGLFLFSIAAAFLIGSAVGWIVGKMGGQLRATRLMMLLFIVGDFGNNIVANNNWIANGTLGVFIPNFFIWYKGEFMLIIAVVTLLVGFIGYIVIRMMLNSPFGRLIRSVRENEVTLESVGKNVEPIRTSVMMFGSGMMAISGVLLANYNGYVQNILYDRVFYSFWPWLMIIIGGAGNNAGAFLGTLLCVLLMKGFIILNQQIGPLLFGSYILRYLSAIEDMILAALLLLFIIYRPQGLIPEKQLKIRGMNYQDLVYEAKPAVPRNELKKS